MEIILYSNKQILGGFVLIAMIGLLFVINFTLSNTVSSSYQGMNLAYFVGPLILTMCILSILYIKSLQDSIQLTMDKYILPDNFTMVNCPDGYNKQTHNGNIKCEPIVGSGDNVVEEGFITESSTLHIAAQQNLSCITGKINGSSAQEYCKSVGKKLKIDGQCSTSEVTDIVTQWSGQDNDFNTALSNINSGQALAQGTQGDSQSCDVSDCCEDLDVCFPGPNHQSNHNCTNGFNPKLQLASNGYIPQPSTTTPCAGGRSTEIPNGIDNSWSPLDSDPYTYCKSPTGSGTDQICPPLDGDGNVNRYELGYECTQTECCECTSPRILNNGVCECPAGMDSIITSTDYGDIHSCACPGEKILLSSGSCSCPDPLMNNDYDNCPCPTTHFTQGTGSSAVCLPNSSLDTTTPVSVSVSGCTDQSATNYDSTATEDDGTCQYISGCTDQSATNHNPVATQDDGSCQYPNTDTGGDAVGATGATTTLPVATPTTDTSEVGATGAVGATDAQPLLSDTLQESYSYPKKAFYLNGNTNEGAPCAPDNIELNGCFNKFPNRIEKCKKIEDFLQNYRAVLNNWTDFQKDCQV